MPVGCPQGTRPVQDEAVERGAIGGGKVIQDDLIHIQWGLLHELKTHGLPARNGGHGRRNRRRLHVSILNRAVLRRLHSGGRTAGNLRQNQVVSARRKRRNVREVQGDSTGPRELDELGLQPQRGDELATAAVHVTGDSARLVPQRVIAVQSVGGVTVVLVAGEIQVPEI